MASSSCTSLWEATAAPHSLGQPLTGAQTADVVVVGAGFTGLSAALHLAEGGASVMVVDRHHVGFGASGRNGGQVIPSLKTDPDGLDTLYGPEATAFFGATADVTFDLIARHGIDCDAERAGWIQLSPKRGHLASIVARARAWERRGVAVELLDRDQVSRRTGSSFFLGGWCDSRAGKVHPLKYVRGLADAARRAGVQIFDQTPVLSLDRQGTTWQVKTPQGVIQTTEVVLATNGYSDGLWPRLKATVVPAGSYQFATAPLSPDLLAEILPGGEVVSETRRVGTYFRVGPQNRLLFGGRGRFRDPQDWGDFARLRTSLAAIYPQLASLPVEYGWGGRVAMTTDHLPHSHQPASGVTVVMGYNGRGVALGTAMGMAVARHLLDPQRAALPLPFRPLSPLWLHNWHPLYASIAIAYYRWRDWLDR